MTYMTVHSDAIRIENLFIEVFQRLGKEVTKYKVSGMLNADNFQFLPISTITISLGWLVFEGGISDETKADINDFRRKYSEVEAECILSGMNPSAQNLGQELMVRMINNLKVILDQIN